MKYFVLAWICVKISSLNVSEYRKHYGLSFYSQCGDYVKTFKCMTACKSIGYQVFRLNTSCKCSCHEMKTSTELPFFKWRTNGTTMQIPKTFSPKLYHVVGTWSPPTTIVLTENSIVDIEDSLKKETTSTSNDMNNISTTECVTANEGSKNQSANLNITDEKTEGTEITTIQ